MNRYLGSLVIGTCLVVAGSDPAAANTTLAQRAPATTSVSQAANAGVVHRVFGWVVNVNGSLLTVQLRGGRLLKVDAAQAMRFDRVSEPLYRGKPTVVTGTVGGGLLYATSVVRAAPQSASWDLDR